MFYLTYHLYRDYFPLLALAACRAAGSWALNTGLYGAGNRSLNIAARKNHRSLWSRLGYGIALLHIDALLRVAADVTSRGCNPR